MTINSNNNNIQSFVNNDNQINKTLDRIAAGIEINNSSNDAASLTISANLQVQASGLSQSFENANNGLALSQIGDRALQEQSNILDNIRKDLLQASTDTTSQEGRNAILENIQKSLQQLNNIASQTNFNGTNLLQASSTDNSASLPQEFQVGTASTDTISSHSIQSNTSGLELEELVNQDSSTFDASTAREFLENVDNALNTLDNNRANFGATSNQLGSSSVNLASQYTGIQEANSILKEINYAEESSNFSNERLTSQIGSLVLSQSNNITQQSVSRLLQ